jgi:hypothetical protein
MKACLPPSAPSCHSRQKMRSPSFHSTSTDSSSQPAPNRADAFIVGSPPRLKVPLSPATPRTRVPGRSRRFCWPNTRAYFPSCPGGRSGVDRPRPEKPGETMPVPRPYADSGGPSSGQRQAFSCPASVPDSTYVVVRPARVTNSQPSGPCEGCVLRSTAPVPVAGSAVPPRPIVEAHIHPVCGVGRWRPNSGLRHC